MVLCVALMAMALTATLLPAFLDNVMVAAFLRLDTGSSSGFAPYSALTIRECVHFLVSPGAGIRQFMYNFLEKTPRRDGESF